MNIRHIALFAFAAALTAGCTPKNPPSDVSGLENGDTSKVTTGPGTGGEITGGPGGGDTRPNFPGLAGWDGDINKLPPEAIVYVVHFGFDKYNVEASERAKIDGAVASLKGHPAVCAGYTDHFGTEEYNLGLSDKRANSVKAYLESSGVGNTDIRAFGSQQAKKSGSKDEVADDRKVVIIDPSKVK